MGVSWAQAVESPYQFLATAYVAWKAILFAIAISSPGLGYDTSSSLLLSTEAIGNTSLPPILGHLIGKLTRWDAIYFVKAANRGYLYEQEWAFGWGFTQLIACITEGLTRVGVPNYDGLESLVGIWIASLSHLLSVFALFSLTCALFPSTSSKRLALTTSFLHIISPAGLFLSAPYAESSCALLSFVGCLLFTKSFSFNSKSSISHDLLLLASGITFGTAATFRSNSILNGLFFVEEASRSLMHLQYGFSLVRIRRLLMTGLGGMSVGIGFLLPQYIAYKEFCSGSSELAHRPWCQNTVPSIYTFVQEHYWNCGFLRYWKAPNAPLFLLAAPMFTVMVLSGIWGLNINTTLSQDKEMTEAKQISIERTAHGKALVRNMAMSQLLLILLTLTGAHVQIITRISSAYPVWMWYLGHRATSSQKMPSQRVEYFTRFMVVYAIIQAGLFASFLPPA